MGSRSLRHFESVSSRRDFLRRAGAGCGALALAMLEARNGRAGEGSTAAQPHTRAPHFPAKAKSIIWIFADGGASHIDLFDPKPELNRLAGKPLPDSWERPETAMGGNGQFAPARLETDVSPVWPIGSVGERLAAPFVGVRRRFGDHSQLCGGRANACRQRLPDEHGKHSRWASVVGLVAAVWAGERSGRSSGLRGTRRRFVRSAGKLAQLGTGLHAGRLSGNATTGRQRADPLFAVDRQEGTATGQAGLHPAAQPPSCGPAARG